MSNFDWIEEAPGDTRIAKLRYIVDNHECRKIDGYLVDATTANLLVSVYNAMKKKSNRAKFESISLVTLVDFAWSVVK